MIMKMNEKNEKQRQKLSEVFILIAHSSYHHLHHRSYLSLWFDEYYRTCSSGISELLHGTALLRSFHNHCKGSKPAEQSLVYLTKQQDGSASWENLINLQVFKNSFNGYTKTEEEERINHFILVRFWQWRSCNFHVQFLPYLRHITDWLRAKRASISVTVTSINLCKFPNH